MAEYFNDEAKAFIIAEAGINHNGDIELAKNMILAAKASGADAIKFQTFKASEFCGDPTQLFTYKSQGVEVTEPMLEMFQRVEFNEIQWGKIAEFCASNDIVFMSTPQNVSDLEILLKIGIPCIKVGSDDLTNTPLISEYAHRGLPLILSSGMASMGDVDAALRAAGWPKRQDISILVCTSQYPTPPEDSNVSRVATILSSFPGVTAGFSDHTQGNTSAIMAYALGARIFEKHFTINHDLPGPDHWFSPDPSELGDWVRSIREAESCHGSGRIEPSETELSMRILARRSVVVTKPVVAGDKLTIENLALKRPGGGLPPSDFAGIIGRIARKDLEAGTLLGLGDFQ
jgi:N,N'-diacetyllegionaminate synthase